MLDGIVLMRPEGHKPLKDASFLWFVLTTADSTFSTYWCDTLLESWDFDAQNYAAENAEEPFLLISIMRVLFCCGKLKQSWSKRTEGEAATGENNEKLEEHHAERICTSYGLKSKLKVEFTRRLKYPAFQPHVV